MFVGAATVPSKTCRVDGRGLTETTEGGTESATTPRNKYEPERPCERKVATVVPGVPPQPVAPCTTPEMPDGLRSLTTSPEPSSN